MGRIRDLDGARLARMRRQIANTVMQTAAASVAPKPSLENAAEGEEATVEAFLECVPGTQKQPVGASVTRSKEVSMPWWGDQPVHREEETQATLRYLRDADAGMAALDDLLS